MKRQRAAILLVGIAIALIIAVLLCFSHEAFTAANGQLPTGAIIPKHTELMMTKLSTFYEITFYQ
jgi:hypothetical protein